MTSRPAQKRCTGWRSQRGGRLCRTGECRRPDRLGGHVAGSARGEHLVAGPFGVLGTLCTVPILTRLAASHSAIEAFFLILAALVIVSGYTAINAVVKAELFPAP